MKVKLLKDVLVGDADVQPTLKNTVVDLDDSTAKDFIAAGLAEATKSMPEPKNKAMPEPENKSKKK